ncbi:unnamed protein product, partial [Mycena citricolor]
SCDPYSSVTVLSFKQRIPLSRRTLQTPFFSDYRISFIVLSIRTILFHFVPEDTNADPLVAGPELGRRAEGSHSKGCGYLQGIYARASRRDRPPRSTPKPSVPADHGPQSQSMVDAMTTAGLHPSFEMENRTLAWTISSLSDDNELQLLVEALPHVLWDFEKTKLRGGYRMHFLKLLRDPLLSARVIGPRPPTTFPAPGALGRLRFLPPHGQPLECLIGDHEPGKALLGSNFIDSEDVQNMVPNVSALIRLNVIESQSQQRAPGGSFSQTSNSDQDIRARMEKQRRAEKQRTKLTRSGSDEIAVDNLVFAARQMISTFAQTSTYPDLFGMGFRGLAPLLVRLCKNLKYQRGNSEHQLDLQASVDTLQLIYHHLVNTPAAARDIDCHLWVLRRLRRADVQAADTHTHRLVATVQCAVLRCFRLDLSDSGDLLESMKLLRMFNNEAWFRAVISHENEKQREWASAKQLYDWACVGVVTAFFEQCARNPDQTEHRLEVEEFKTVHMAPQGSVVSSVAPGETNLELRLNLAQNDIAGLESHLLAAATPGSANYGQCLSAEETGSPHHPPVSAWLLAHGVDSTKSSPSGDCISVNVPVPKANEQLGADYHVFTHTANVKTSIRTLLYSLPASLENHINVNFAQAQLDYVLGNNPLPYVLGSNPNSPSNPHSAGQRGERHRQHRHLAGGGAYVLYSAVIAGPDRHARFFDICGDWPEMEVAFDSNAPMLTLAAMHAANDTPGPYFTRLQARAYGKLGDSPCDSAFSAGCGGLHLFKGTIIAMAVVLSVVGIIILRVLIWFIHPLRSRGK